MKRKSFNKILLLLITVLIIGAIYYFVYPQSSFSMEINKNFDELVNDFTKNTKEYEGCMSGEFSDDYFSANLRSKKSEIISLYDGVNADFMYTDLESDYSFGEGIDEETYAASVSKLPAALYIYKMVDDGKVTLDKELTYLEKNKEGGSGIIQKTKVGTKYKISTLLEYMIKYSDNVAYSMLLDEIGGTSVIKDYFASLGYEIKYTDNFGVLTPKLGNDYITEVYNYYLTGKDNAKKLVNDMKVSNNLEYVKSGEVEVAHKYGEYVEGGGYYNDVSLNFSTHPFALSITSTLGLTDKMEDLFLKTHSLSIEFNDLYYEEKSNYCLEKSRI